MILIGITGKAGSGKDTVGAILHEKHNFACVAFATPIKAMICQLLGVPRKIWDDRVWRETELPIFNCSPRVLAQTIGTEWGRHLIADDLWLDLALAQVKMKKHQPCWAITDVRFDNEAIKIREQGGYIVHVTRKVKGVGTVGHASEKGIKKVAGDYTITNDLSLDALYVKTNILVKDIAKVERGKLDKEEAARLAEDKKRAKKIQTDAARRKRSRR